MPLSNAIQSTLNSIVGTVNDSQQKINAIEYTLNYDLPEKNSDQDNRLDVIETTNSAQGGRLDVIETITSVHDGRLDLIETTNSVQGGRLDVIETTTSVHDGRLDVLETNDPLVENRISSVENKLSTGPMISSPNLILISYYNLADLPADSDVPKVLGQDEVDYLNTLSKVSNSQGSWHTSKFLNNRVGATEVIEFLIFRRMEDINKLFENSSKFIDIAVKRHGKPRFNFGVAGAKGFVVGAQTDLDTFKAFLNSDASMVTHGRSFNFGFPLGLGLSLRDIDYIPINDIGGEILAYSDRMVVIYDKAKDQENGYSQENVDFIKELSKQALKSNVGTAQAFASVNSNLGEKYSFKLIVLQSNEDHRNFMGLTGDVISKTKETVGEDSSGGIAMESFDILGANAGLLENFCSNVGSLPNWSDLSEESKRTWSFVGESKWNNISFVELFKNYLGVKGFNFISLPELPIEYRQLLIEGDKNVVKSKLQKMKILSQKGVILNGLNEPFKTGVYKTGEIYLFVKITKSVQAPDSNYFDSIINQDDQNGDTVYSALATASPYCKYLSRSSALGTSTCVEVVVFETLDDCKNFANSIPIYVGQLQSKGYAFTSGVFRHFRFVSDIPDLEDKMKTLDNTWSTLTSEQQGAKTAQGLNQTMHDTLYPTLYDYYLTFVSDPSILKFYNSLRDPTVTYT